VRTKWVCVLELCTTRTVWATHRHRLILQGGKKSRLSVDIIAVRHDANLGAKKSVVDLAPGWNDS
jgi:hypothetical protein